MHTEKMDHPFFYVKVDMDCLKEYCSDMKKHEITPPYDTYFNLPLPHRKYSYQMQLKTDIPRETFWQIGLNPKAVSQFNNLLSTGALAEFDGIEGVWSLITHCQECFRGFLGQRYFSKNSVCRSTNCANNVLFRQEMKKQNRFFGS